MDHDDDHDDNNDLPPWVGKGTQKETTGDNNRQRIRMDRIDSIVIVSLFFNRIVASCKALVGDKFDGPTGPRRGNFSKQHRQKNTTTKQNFTIVDVTMDHSHAHVHVFPPTCLTDWWGFKLLFMRERNHR